MQLNQKQLHLGSYAVEADAAAARDVVAKVLAYPLNFNEPREITGQRSKGADQAVADAVKAANAFLLGDSLKCFLGSKQVTNQNPEYHYIPDASKLKAQAMSDMKPSKLTTASVRRPERLSKRRRLPLTPSRRRSSQRL